MEMPRRVGLSWIILLQLCRSSSSCVDVSDAEVSAATYGGFTSCTQVYLAGGCTDAAYGAVARGNCCASCTTPTPTSAPSHAPTSAPSHGPTSAPSFAPTSPSYVPTSAPSIHISPVPTSAPTIPFYHVVAPPLDCEAIGGIPEEEESRTRFLAERHGTVKKCCPASCTRCMEGRSGTEGAGLPLECQSTMIPDNQICGAPPCTLWPAGSATLNCSSGMFSSGASCENCAVGQFQDGLSSLSACFSCFPGQFQNSTGRASCSNCPLGKYTDYGGLAFCFPCFYTSYSKPAPDPTSRDGSCASCPDGYYSTIDFLSCSRVCRDPTQAEFEQMLLSLPNTLTEQIKAENDGNLPPNCTDGSGSFCESSSAFIKLAAEQFCPVTCDACYNNIPTPVPTIAPTPAPTGTTTTCPAGYYLDNGRVKECPAGKHQTDADMPSCSLCQSGKFQTEEAAIVCHFCPQVSSCLSCSRSLLCLAAVSI
jgi:hypothetical protein